MAIHTIGDSHSQCGWRDVKCADVNINWLGPKLCYTIGNDPTFRSGSQLTSRTKINNGDTFVFCFGEIDCRAHIHKHASKENNSINYKDQIDGIVERYFTVLKNSIEKIKINKQDLKFFVYNVVPPPADDFVKQSAQYPTLGNQYERLSYVRYFNKKIDEYCNNTELKFFNIYDYYADKNGFMNMKYCDGTHIIDPQFIEEFCKKHGIT